MLELGPFPVRLSVPAVLLGLGHQPQRQLRLHSVLIATRGCGLLSLGLLQLAHVPTVMLVRGHQLLVRPFLQVAIRASLDIGLLLSPPLLSKRAICVMQVLGLHSRGPRLLPSVIFAMRVLGLRSVPLLAIHVI